MVVTQLLIRALTKITENQQGEAHRNSLSLPLPPSLQPLLFCLWVASVGGNGIRAGNSIYFHEKQAG